MDHSYPSPTPPGGRASTGDAALEVARLSKSFGPRPALQDVSFRAERGHVTALLGPNGAGKTTLISCATGLLAPDSGTVRVLGHDPLHTTAAQRARVGVMVQEGGLASGARAMQLLRYGASLHTNPLDVEALAQRLGITDFARTIVRRLSGGQRQRLALALAVVGRPELVFLDEPTAGMDPGIRRTVRTLIRELTEDGVGVILTTHLMDDVIGLADRLVILREGRLLREGAIDEVLAHHRGSADTVSLTARFSQVPAAREAALREGLVDLASTYGAQIRLDGADATALEDVLVDLEGETR